MVKLNDLIDFKNEADAAGYERDKPQHMKKEKDGSTTIWYERGEWKFHDNFFGGEPYGGRAVIHYKNNKLVYQAKFMGGLVDQRAGD